MILLAYGFLFCFLPILVSGMLVLPLTGITPSLINLKKYSLGAFLGALASLVLFHRLGGPYLLWTLLVLSCLSGRTMVWLLPTPPASPSSEDGTGLSREQDAG